MGSDQDERVSALGAATPACFMRTANVRATNSLGRVLVALGVFILAGLAHATTPQSCDALSQELYRGGVVQTKIFEAMCGLGCPQALDCPSDQPVETRPSLYERLTMFAESPEFDSIPSLLNEDAGLAVEFWWRLVTEAWPVFMAIVPVLLMRTGMTWLGVTWTVGYSMYATFGSEDPYVIRIFNIVIGVFSVLLRDGGPVLTEAVLVFGMGMLVYLIALLGGPVWQFATIVLAFLSFGGAVHWMLLNKKSNSGAAIVLTILLCEIFRVQLGMMAERKRFTEEAYQVQVMTAFIGIFSPHGKYGFFAQNALRLCIAVSKSSEYYHAFHFFSLLALQVLGAIVFRAGLGMCYIASMRYKFNPENLMAGGLIYACDAFGPLIVGFRIIAGHEKIRSRRVLYSAVGAVMLWFESQAAQEIFMLRVVMSSADMIFGFSGYSKFSYALCYELDFHLAEFKQRGSVPWLNSALLREVEENVRVVVSTIDGAVSRGLGFISRSHLYTVSHVVNGAEKVRFGRDVCRSGDLGRVGDGGDPVAFLPASEFGADISLLSRAEVHDIKSVFFCVLRRGEDGLPVSHFDFPKTFKIASGGDLLVAVDLQHGDSGGPVFAVLGSGDIRYAGAVSRGTTDQGHGNYVSTVLLREVSWRGESSSDEEGPSSFFERRRSPAFVCATLGLLPRKLSDDLRDAMPSLEKFQDGCSHPSTLLSEWGELEAPRREPDEGAGTRRGRRVKKPNKDEAARKRRELMDMINVAMWELSRDADTIQIGKMVYGLLLSGKELPVISGESKTSLDRFIRECRVLERK